MKKIALAVLLLYGVAQAKQKDKLAVTLTSDIIVKSKSNHKSNVTFTKSTKSTKKVIVTAKTRLGRKYRYGKYDCSKFVQDVIGKTKGIKLPRTTRQQIKIGKKISKKNAKRGDLVFFGDSNHRVGHVGIIIDPKKMTMIHNSSSKGKVVISSYNTKYYNRKFRGIRRV